LERKQTNNKRGNRLLNERLITMNNETKIYILSALVMLAVGYACLMIGLDREIEREKIQTQSWKDQGYPIGE